MFPAASATLGTVSRCRPRDTSDPGDDEALSAAFAAGVDGAMRRVWDRYGTLVHTFCIRSLSDRDLAADCTQETFISAWRSRDRFDPALGSLPAWLLGIARHRVHDAYRTRARTPSWTPAKIVRPSPTVLPTPRRRTSWSGCWWRTRWPRCRNGRGRAGAGVLHRPEPSARSPSGRSSRWAR